MATNANPLDSALSDSRKRYSRTAACQIAACAALAASALFLSVGAHRATAADAVANGRIVYMSDADGDAEIYTMNPDGGEVTQLTSNTSHGVGNTPTTDKDPAWSPDGTKIAFATDRDGNYEIYVMNKDGSGQTNLTNSPGTSDGNPTWSPDGMKIAFERLINRALNDWEIFTVDAADGGEQTDVSADATATARDQGPSWSPDGEWIAFHSNYDPDLGTDDYDIWVVNPDDPSIAGDLTSSSSAKDQFPAWSADGTKLGFSSDRAGSDLDIWAISPDGSNPTQLTSGTGNDVPGAWSPDGTRIAFHSDRTGSGDFDVYTMNSDGTGEPADVAGGVGVQAAPDWQRVPTSPLPGPSGSEPTGSDQSTADTSGESGAASTDGSADTVAPTITRLRVSHKRSKVTAVTARTKKGVSFRFKLSEAASVKIRLYRRRAHGKRSTSIGTLNATGKSGTNTVKLSKGLARKLAHPAGYEAKAQATDVAGNKSKKTSVTFKVVRG